MSPSDSGLVTAAPPTLRSAAFAIVRSAAGPISWVKPALLFDRSGSPVLELTAAESAIVCPAVFAATVPLIVIVVVVFAAIVPSVHTSVPPVVGSGEHVAPVALVAVNWLGSKSLTTTCCALSGPLLVTVNV